MQRTANDTWDLATSVGATATMVAAGRARATKAALIEDRFAEPLMCVFLLPRRLLPLDRASA